jgi:hypothetical protein
MFQCAYPKSSGLEGLGCTEFCMVILRKYPSEGKQLPSVQFMQEMILLRGILHNSRRRMEQSQNSSSDDIDDIGVEICVTPPEYLLNS